MATGQERLQGIAEDMKRGLTPNTVSVRELLTWFGVSRRGSNVVRAIRRALEQAGLATVPDFEGAWVDFRIRFVTAGSEDDDGSSSTTYRIDALESANRKPLSTLPDSPLGEAITVMLTNDYSQLPVMTSERNVEGAVSWKSIGSRLALGKECSLVRDCTDTAIVMTGDASLFAAIGVIASDDYVLVEASDKTISGIVTASDLSQQVRDLAEPFLLIGQIESLLRRLIHGKFTAEELAQAKNPSDADRTVEGVADLTFGEYIRLLENKERWTKLAVSVDRKEFIRQCSRTRDIRNDVMHFDPQGVDPDALSALQEFGRFLEELRRLGVI